MSGQRRRQPAHASEPEPSVIRDDDAERDVLGGMIVGPAGIASAVEHVTADDFYLASLATIFRTIVEMHERGEHISSTTVVNALAKLPNPDSVDWRATVRTLAAGGLVGGVDAHARIVAAVAQQRRVRDLAAQLAHDAANGYDLERAADVIEQLATANRPRAGRAWQARFRTFTSAELAQIPPPEFLIEPYLVRGAFNLLFGDQSAYKSFVAIAWSLTIATPGATWFGQPVQHGPVVYIVGEGASGTHQRIEAWADTFGIDPDPPGVVWVPDAVNLFRPDEVGDLTRWLGTLPEMPVLVVADTIARCSVGADDGTQSGSTIVASIDRIRQQGPAFLGITHTGHEQKERERGSSAIPNAADVRVQATRPCPLQTRLEVRKVKDADDARPPVTLLLAPARRSIAVAERRDSAVERSYREQIIEHLTANPAGALKGELRMLVKVRNAEMGDVLAPLLGDGSIVELPDRGNAKRYVLRGVVPTLGNDPERHEAPDQSGVVPPTTWGTTGPERHASRSQGGNDPAGSDPYDDDLGHA